MKRPSGTGSYLQQLAAPVPSAASLLRTHRPAQRGVAPLAAIPPIVDSISEDPTSSVTARRSSATPRMQLPREQVASSKDFPVVSHTARESQPAPFVSFATNSSVPVPHEAAGEEKAPREAIVQPGSLDATVEAVSSHENPSRHSQFAPVSTSARKSIAPRSAVAPGEDRKQSFEPTPAVEAPPISLHFSNRTEPASSERTAQGNRIHIGTVEVRTTAPAREQPSPVVNRRMRAGRSAMAAEPLARPMAWSHGLVQG